MINYVFLGMEGGTFAFLGVMDRSLTQVSLDAECPALRRLKQNRVNFCVSIAELLPENILNFKVGL